MLHTPRRGSGALFCTFGLLENDYYDSLHAFYTPRISYTTPGHHMTFKVPWLICAIASNVSGVLSEAVICPFAINGFGHNLCSKFKSNWIFESLTNVCHLCIDSRRTSSGGTFSRNLPRL